MSWYSLPSQYTVKTKTKNNPSIQALEGININFNKDMALGYSSGNLLLCNVVNYTLAAG